MKSFVLSLFLFSSLHAGSNHFGGWQISKHLFDHILELVDEGDTIVELGSGWATSQLIKHFKVYSIEHNPKYLNKCGSNYIYAPIKDGWYDVEAVKQGLPKKYSLILVDGPPYWIGRAGFIKNFALFRSDVPIIFDDVNRKKDLLVAQAIAKILGKELNIITDKTSSKKFAVIY